MKSDDIIIRNFYRMLRSGAMNEYVDMEPMSPHKWRKLANMMVREGVANVATRAVKNHQFEDSFNMPKDVRDMLYEEAVKKVGQNIRATMNNPSLNKKLNKISTNEHRSETYSKESLDLFGIIIANCQHMLNKGTSTRLIIRLGNYIRINADKVDYTKVNRWLKELQMHRVACLVGSILIVNFAFQLEEVPFVKKVDEKAARLMTIALTQESSAWQNKAFTYFEYAPLENVSILLKSLKTRLDSIEE